MMLFAQVDWVQLLETFGLAVCILLFVGYAGWKGAGWFGREIIIPIRDRALLAFVGFLDRTEKTVGKIDSTVEKMDVNIDTVTGNLTAQTTTLQGIKDINVKTHETAQKMVGVLEDEHGSLKVSIADAIKKADARHENVMAEFQKVHAEMLVVIAKVEKISPSP